MEVCNEPFWFALPDDDMLLLAEGIDVVFASDEFLVRLLETPSHAGDHPSVVKNPLLSLQVLDCTHNT
jgi:hypothetical protein